MSADERWAQVEARNAGSDGAFVYAVRTTGVYCRPSCPSRRPLRRNVRFFERPAAAEAAGYRACLRCRPQERDGATSPRMVQAVADACRVLDSSSEAPALAELARLVDLSPSYLHRSFTRLVGSTPRQYASAVRLERAKRALRAGTGVTESLYGAGYGSSRAFYEGATGDLGMQPAVYRRGGAGVSISYTTVVSPLGSLLIAATGQGVCAVRFLGPVPGDIAEAAGTDEAADEDALRGEFPGATLRRDDGALRATAERVVALTAGGPDDPGLPLDVRATAFQLQVWRALRAIPRGQTRSYTEVARSIGRPAAVRAVAAACAANPVAVVVPCHRVVAADGALAGYRWGIGRKRALLDAEQAGTAASPGRAPDRPASG